jgi:hypothetical protein
MFLAAAGLLVPAGLFLPPALLRREEQTHWSGGFQPEQDPVSQGEQAG